MIVKKNSEALVRKSFLIRSLEHHNITKEEYLAEIKLLDPFIKKNLDEALLKCKEDLKTQMRAIQKTSIEEGPLKRAIANLLINFLETELTQDEIKGVFRQGYKIMRGKHE